VLTHYLAGDVHQSASGTSSGISNSALAEPELIIQFHHHREGIDDHSGPNGLVLAKAGEAECRIVSRICPDVMMYLMLAAISSIRTAGAIPVNPSQAASRLSRQLRSSGLRRSADYEQQSGHDQGVGGQE